MKIQVKHTRNFYFLSFIIGLSILGLTSCISKKEVSREIIPSVSEHKFVSDREMQDIYDEVKTPYKYGIVLRGEEGRKVDCPSVFRHDGFWYMTYIIFDGKGYETALAKSADLLHWQKMGVVLPFREGTWDSNQAAGYIALQDHQWGGSYALRTHDDKYWMSYLGGSLEGYETDPLAIGMAWTKDLVEPEPWKRLEDPVLTREQKDCRYWEMLTQYKSNIIFDKDGNLGWPYVMYYNAKTEDGYERIGMAVSDNMTQWYRYGNDPVIDNGSGISGDPQITRIGDLWVMFYFGAFWRPGAFDTFACSHDMVYWTKWEGTDLILPSEPWDETYAHKPWVIKHNGVVYHYYCAVGSEGRVIALATSTDLKK